MKFWSIELMNYLSNEKNGYLVIEERVCHIASANLLILVYGKCALWLWYSLKLFWSVHAQINKLVLGHVTAALCM